MYTYVYIIISKCVSAFKSVYMYKIMEIICSCELAELL